MVPTNSGFSRARRPLFAKGSSSYATVKATHISHSPHEGDNHPWLSVPGSSTRDTLAWHFRGGYQRNVWERILGRDPQARNLRALTLEPPPEANTVVH